MADLIPGNTSTTYGLDSAYGTSSSAIDFSGDTDWYRVSLSYGYSYQTWVQGFGSGNGTLDDPYLAIYNAAGLLLQFNDDGSGRDSFINFAPSVSGTYYLSAQEYSNSATGTYLITVLRDELASIGSVAVTSSDASYASDLGYGVDTADWVSITLQAGASYQFDLIGSAADGESSLTLDDPLLALRNNAGTMISVDDDSGVELNSRLFYTPSISGTYFLDVGRAGSGGSGAYLLISNVTPVVGSIAMGATVAGSITFSGDTDLFSVSLTAGVAYDFLLNGTTLSDPFLELLNASGAVLEFNDDSSGLDAALAYTPPSSGTYYLAARDSGNNSTGSYALSVVAQTAAGDRFEDNDTALTATDLRTISGTVTETGLSVQSNDADWYRFTLPGAGRTGDAVTASFTHSLGDVDMALYDSTGTTELLNAEGVGNQEQISLAGLAAGSYLVKVYGYDTDSNPSYSLDVSAAPQTAAGDRFEDNDTALTATDLRTISGTVTETGLSVQSNDADWYRFTLPGAGRTGDAVTASFTHSLGDVDMALYDSTGTTELLNAEGVGNQEQISLAGLAAGSYLVKVYGYDTDSNPSYSLDVSAAPQTAAGDRFEDNDTALTATDLRTISGTVIETGLSVQSNDADWYRFTLPGAGRTGDAVTASFTHSLGDVDMALYDSTGTSVLLASGGLGNQEQISLAGLAAGSYLVKVYGYGAASNPSYSLDVSAAPQTAAGDRFEDNDTALTATDLRTISGTVIETGLSVQSNDADWYRFTLPGAGRTGDAVTASFTHSLGDVDMALYDSTGTSVLLASGGLGNQEQISLAGLAAGSYLVKVYGYGAASNPSYSLDVSAAPQTAAGDRFEDNDTALTATDLRTISGTVIETGLSVQSNDADWYRFTLPGAGRTGDAVTASFTHSLGDVDMALYDSTGTSVLLASGGLGNQEQISLAGLAAGSYLVKVYGYGATSNPDYSLDVSAAQASAITADPWEQNNTSAQATVIRASSQTLNAATITPGDQDWYSFVLTEAGATSDRVTVQASGSDLLVQVLDTQENIVAQATSDASGLANISLSGQAAAQYLIKVSGQTTSSQAQYDLDLRAIGASPTAGSGTWTVLVFLNGDNNLEGAAVKDVNEMEAALNRAGINVGVQMDRIADFDGSNGNWTDTRRGVIVHDTDMSTISTAFTSIGEVDMGSRQALIDFINWGTTNLPAENYLLVIWDHGGGILSGSSFDDTSGNYLSNADVAQAIRNSQVGRVDVVGFDACLMGAIEVASQVAPVASILVAAERTEPGDGWDYTAMLSALQGTTTGAEFASVIVDTYGDFYGQANPLSAIALNETGSVEAALNGFVTVMRTGSTADWQSVATARTRAATADSGFQEYVDIVSFMLEVMALSSNAVLDNAAQEVVTAVGASVLRLAGPPILYGLTIEFPLRGKVLSSSYTAANHDFVANTDWEDFLQLYLSRGTRSVGTGFESGPADFAEFLNLSALANSLRNDSVSTPFRIGGVNQANYVLSGLNLDSTQDFDWFSFTLPIGAGYLPSATVQVVGAVAGVNARLTDSSGALIAEATSSATVSTLSFGQLVPGSTYLLGVSGAAAASQPYYEIHLDAFGLSAAASALPDFSESGGGNNGIAKAWTVGTASQLEQYGVLRDLSLDTADLQSGAAGGDWFRVDSIRVTESNANRVEVVDVAGPSNALSIKVFDIVGNLIAQSDQPGDLIVTFASQVDDVFVQIQSTQTQPVLSYGLKISNEPVDTTAPTVLSFNPVDEATGVAVGANVVVTFSEVIQRGTGSIVLKAATGTTIETFDTASNVRLTLSGATLTINPTADLATGTGYQLEFAAGTLQDLAGNPYAGTASYNFTTIGVIGGLTGGDGNDQLQGSAASETFTTGLGNDIVTAGDGQDTVILPLFPNVYSLSENPAGHVTGNYGANLIYSLALNDVEFVQFGRPPAAGDPARFQTTLALSELVTGEAQLQLGRLTDLYLAFFGRAPDVGGLEYWQERLLEEGRDFATISKDFAFSDEAQALFPATGSNRDFVQTVYVNSFGRQPDAGGWDYWTGRLDGLGVTDLNDRGAFVGEVILGAYAPSSGEEDRALLTNRHEAAMYYVNRLWTTPAEIFDTAINTLLARVTGNPLTEDKAEAVIDHAFANPVTLSGIMTNPALLDDIWL